MGEPNSDLRAVVFDLGGVVLDSPMHVIGDYERRHGLDAGAINSSVVESGSNGAWARHERGELDRSSFLDEFAKELRGRGHEVDTARLMDEVEGSFTVRPAMVRAIERIRSRGIAAAAITNNWEPFDPAGVPALFDVFLESVTEGVRKPEEEIYRRCLDRLGVDGNNAAMLDDLGPNLKPARALGMATIKVVNERQALEDLGTLLGFSMIA